MNRQKLNILKFTRPRIFLALIIIGLVSSFIIPIKANAAITDAPVFIDKTTITWNGRTFKDVNPYDSKYNYVSGSGSCKSTIDVINFGSSQPRASIQIRGTGQTGHCDIDPTKSPKGSITNGQLALADAGKKNITAYKIGADDIFLPVGTKNGGCATSQNDYLATDGGSAYYHRLKPSDAGYKNNHDFYLVKNGSNVGGSNSLDDRSYTTWYDYKSTGALYGFGTCVSGSDYDHKIGDLAYANNGKPVSNLPSIYGDGASTPGGGTGSGGSGTGASIDKNSCENISGPLGWIMCPVVDLLDSALNWVDTQIQALLVINKGSYDDPSGQMKNAWGNIRNIAYIILVPVMLVMVVSTALGFEFISAYTVKKALPRLVAAAIFITLSYAICTFLIGFFNVIGTGILGLITTPFTDATLSANGLTLASLFKPIAGSTSGVAGAASALGGLVTAAAGGIGIIIVLWLFGGTLLLFAGVAFLVLILRQMFVMALLLVAPLAIISWIFPGNDRLWKNWWGSFWKLLGMFPLIMLLIGVGRIFAFIVATTTPFPPVLNSIVKLIAYMIPYAFIPFTFKVAGGAFSTLAGVVNDRSKGLFDRQKKSRAAKLERTSNQKLFKNANENSRIGRMKGRLNTVGGGVMHANRAGIDPRRWKERIGGGLTDNTIQQRGAMLEDKDYTWQNDDDLNRAAAESSDAKSLEANLLEADRRRVAAGGTARYAGPDGHDNMRRDISRVENMRKKYGNSAFRQATWMRAVAGGTAYDGADAWAAAARISGGNSAILSDLVGQGKGIAMNGGRVDQGGAGFGDTYEIARRSREGYTDASGRTFTGAEYVSSGLAQQHMSEAVLKSQGAGVLTHASMKKKGIENLTPVIQQQVREAIASGDQARIDSALANVANIHDGLAGSSPQLADEFAETVFGDSIDVASLPDGARSAFEDAIQDSGGVQEVHVRDPATGNMVVTRQAVSPSSRRVINVKQAIDARRTSSEFQLKRRELTAEQQQQASVGGGAGGGPGSTAGGNPLAGP